MSTRSICQALFEARTRSGIAVKTKQSGKWQDITWKQYYADVEQAAGGLLHFDIEADDKVAILSETRYEWSVCDMAILSLGAVTVPIYSSNTPEDVSYILNNSEAKILILENKEHYKKWQKIKSECSKVESVIYFNIDKSEDNQYIAWKELLKFGSLYKAKHPHFLENKIELIEKEKLATLVYTSGTTGKPKGVMLSHTQILSEIQDAFTCVNISDQDTSLTFLPYAHIFGRVELWAHIYSGFTMGYAESIEKIRANLEVIRPSFLLAVPRIFEKIYNGVITQAEADPKRLKIFKWAVRIGKEVSILRMEKQEVPLALLLKYKLAQKLVFDKLKNKLGGNLRFALSGGAPLSKEIGEFFHAAGILILEGYGLTETTAAVCVNTPMEYRFGTVGKPIGEVEVKIADDGEVLLKSKKIMQGYYKNLQATSEVLQNGWFSTGDIGELTPEGYLRITDRKKDLIKTAGGKYIAPQKLENLLVLNKFIANVLIHGDKKKYVVALLVPNFENLEQFAVENSISFNNTANLVAHPKVQKLYKDVIAEANSHLASYESMKNFAVLDHSFSIEDGQLTPSLKVKRKFCDLKYTSIIENLYGPDAHCN